MGFFIPLVLSFYTVAKARKLHCSAVGAGRGKDHEQVPLGREEQEAVQKGRETASGLDLKAGDMMLECWAKIGMWFQMQVHYD